MFARSCCCFLCVVLCCCETSPPKDAPDAELQYVFHDAVVDGSVDVADQGADAYLPISEQFGPILLASPHCWTPFSLFTTVSDWADLAAGSLVGVVSDGQGNMTHDHPFEYHADGRRACDDRCFEDIGGRHHAFQPDGSLMVYNTCVTLTRTGMPAPQELVQTYFDQVIACAGREGAVVVPTPYGVYLDGQAFPSDEAFAAALYMIDLCIAEVCTALSTYNGINSDDDRWDDDCDLCPRTPDQTQLDSDQDMVGDSCDCETIWGGVDDELCWMPGEHRFGRCRCDPGLEEPTCDPVEGPVKDQLFLPPPSILEIAAAAVPEPAVSWCEVPEGAACSPELGYSFERATFNAMRARPENATLRRDRGSTGYLQVAEVCIRGSMFGNEHAYDVCVPAGTQRYADMVRTRILPECGAQTNVEAFEQFELKCRPPYELANFRNKYWALDAEYGVRAQMAAYLDYADHLMLTGTPAFTTYVSCNVWALWMQDIFRSFALNQQGLANPRAPFWFTQNERGPEPPDGPLWFQSMVLRSAANMAIAVEDSDDPGGLHEYVRGKARQANVLPLEWIAAGMFDDFED